MEKMVVHSSDQSKKSVVNNINVVKRKKVIPMKKTVSDPKTILDNEIKNIKVDPLYMLPILKMIMDSKNPDNDIIQTKISESITSSIKKDRAFMKKAKEEIMKNIVSITTESFKDSMEKIEEDIQTILIKTITKSINEYKDIKLKEIDEIFDDYFKKLTEIINKKLEEVENKTVSKCKEAENKIEKVKDKTKQISINIPEKNLKEIQRYLKMIQDEE